MIPLGEKVLFTTFLPGAEALFTPSKAPFYSIPRHQKERPGVYSEPSIHFINAR